MTITLAWWTLPIAFVVLGIVGAFVFGRSRGDYDMVSPLLGLGCILGGLIAAVALLIGKWLA